ncbi:MAG: NAD-dependent epimerase/dehydratase family protein [Alphaproteobacteria bacterium]|nr:NAD-dependent epimerase/dehydratase family protein [Alphaproteobacteria bacterium]
MTAPILVIGATGQIGENVMRQAEGRVALALARDPSRVRASPATLVQRIETSHGLPNVPAAWPASAISTLPVWMLPDFVAPMAGHGVRRLVCFSTTSIFGKSGTRSPREHAVVQQVREAEAKLGELADRRDVGLTILRPTLIYGEGADKTIAAAARFIERFGVYPVHGCARGKRQPVHAADLATAALATLETGVAVGREYALGGGETLDYRTMIARVFEVLGKPSRIVRVPFLPQMLSVAGALSPGSELTGDVARRMNADLDFDDGTASRDFGYAPRAFLSGGRRDLFGAPRSG